VKELLNDFEAALDPRAPTAKVLAYGEVSVALRIPGLDGMVAKRMAGFADMRMARSYVDLVAQYIDILTTCGVEVVATETVIVTRDRRAPVVYLVQPLLTELGSDLLRSGAALDPLIDAVLDRVWALHERSDAPEVAIDAQLSNWSFAGQPVLLDVGTPFMRAGSRYLFDEEILLSAIPSVARWYYRRKGSIAEYMDDYFDPRLVAVDLLGNFIKEGAQSRLGEGLAVVNAWLAGHGLTEITRPDVQAYYKQDAATLELFLRVRRIDRGLKRVVRRDYDFVLPGRVRR
jgi:hypothetical protein